MYETYDTRLQDYLYTIGFVPLMIRGNLAQYWYDTELQDALDRYYIRTRIFN